MMNLVLGVGNEENGDDGVGPFIAENIDFPGWKGVNCSVSPENYTGVVQQEKPEFLVIVDATEMDLKPGEFRLIPRSRIDELAISTHYMPLSILMRYLSESARYVVFIGVQPKQRDGELSKEVRESAYRLLEYFKQGRLDKIKKLESD